VAISAVAVRPLQGVITAASSGTHTHTHRRGEQASSLALTFALVCGSPKQPERSRRDTGGGLRDGVSAIQVQTGQRMSCAC